MKIIGLNASPRINGNGRSAISKILDDARKAGYETELIDLNLLNMSPCQSCNFCKTHAGLCFLDDDMLELTRKLKKADAFVLASPIYFSQINAQATTFINRLYSFFQTEMVQKHGESYVVTVTNIYDYDIVDSDKLKKIKAGIILTQGLKDENEYTEYINSGIFDQINLLFDLKDVIVLPDSNIPGIINDRNEDLDKISQLSKKLLD